MWGAPSQLIPTNFGTSRSLAGVINHAKFHPDRLRGFRLGRYLKIDCSHRKAWSSLTPCLALPRLYVTRSDNKDNKVHELLFSHISQINDASHNYNHLSFNRSVSQYRSSNLQITLGHQNINFYCIRRESEAVSIFLSDSHVITLKKHEPATCQ